MDIKSFPPNVRRWLERSATTGSQLPKRILNTQEGEMNIRGKWMPFTANTVYRSEPVSFTWKARFKLMPGVWLVAEDGHDMNNGWGSAKLWGLIPMGGQKGTGEVYAMQAVRSLAELPWKPLFAFTLSGAKWEDAGDDAFEVKTMAGEHEITVRFQLNGEGEIIRATGKRYLDVPEGFIESPWRYDFSGHTDIEGIHVPVTAVATYEKPEGSWEYWRGKIISFALEN